jgi:hypothetical protein
VLSLAALLVSAAPAAAHHCRASSTSRGATIVYRTSEAVVFNKGVYTYGCLYRPGDVRRLPTEGGEVDDFVQSGRYLAYSTSGSAIGDEFDRVYVFDLKTGRLLRTYSSTFVSKIVVKRNGSAAWVQASVVQSPAEGQPVREVRKGEVGEVDDELLDRSAGVVPESLALSADRTTVSWTRDGAQRSAPID